MGGIGKESGPERKTTMNSLPPLPSPKTSSSFISLSPFSLCLTLTRTERRLLCVLWNLLYNSETLGLYLGTLNSRKNPYFFPRKKEKRKKKKKVE
jgi:hypothetical protein